MKSLTQCLLGSVLLLNAFTLRAQNENEYTILRSPSLMMDPAMAEEGVKTIERVLGASEGRAVVSEKTVRECQTARLGFQEHAITSSSSSSSSKESAKLAQLAEQAQAEKVTVAIATLSEQKSRCLAAATETTIAGRVDIAEQFNTAAKTAEEAIAAYLQFEQKMKEGDVSTASLIRIKGLSLECQTLEKENRARIKAQAIASVNDNKGIRNFSNVAFNARNAVCLLEQALQANKEGLVDVAKAFEQVAIYHFQAALAAVNLDNTKVESFSNAARSAGGAAQSLKNAIQARSEGQSEVAKTYEQQAQYRLQTAQAVVDGDVVKVESFSKAAFYADNAVDSFQKAAQVVFDEDGGKGSNTAFSVPSVAGFGFTSFTGGGFFQKQALTKTAQGYEEEARHHLRCAEIYAQEGKDKGDAFSQQLSDDELSKQENEFDANSMAQLRANEDQAKNNGQVETAKAFEQAANCHWQAARAATDGDSTKEKNLLSAVFSYARAGQLLKRAALAKTRNNIQTIKDYEKEAHYHLRCAEIYVEEGKEKGDAFSRQMYDDELRQFEDALNSISAEQALKQAAQARCEGKLQAATAYEQAFQAAINKGGNLRKNCFSDFKGISSSQTLKKAAQARSEGQEEVAKAYEQAVQYNFQGVLAAANGDSTQEEVFSSAAINTSGAAWALQKAAQARSEGQEEVAKAHEQEAQYNFQGVQASVNGDKIKADNFAHAAFCTLNVAQALKDTVQARSNGQEEIATTYEQKIQYEFQIAQAAINGDSMKVNSLTNASSCVTSAVEKFVLAYEAKSEGKLEVAKTHEQEACYHLRRAEVYAEEGAGNGSSFSHNVCN